MKNFKIIGLLILLVLIVGLGLKYRLRSYQSIPPIASTFDEQMMVWVGSSLINNGVPTGWSFIGAYGSKNEGHLVNIDEWGISYDGQKPSLSNWSSFPKPLSHSTEIKLDGYTSQFTLVQPYLEQPPLGALLSSFLSGSFRLGTFSDINLAAIRLPVIILSTLSIIILFAVGYFSKNLTVALLGSAIFALTPTIVISQRLAVAENYLTFVLLLTVLVSQLWILKNKHIYLIISCLLIIIGYLIKPFGIGLGIIMISAIVIFNKPKRYLLYPILSISLGALIFIGYGFYYDRNLFLTLVSYQEARLTAPLQAIFKIILPKITKIFLDGWIVFGWLSWGSLTVRENIKSNFWITMPVIIFLFVYLIYGGEDQGWYRLVFYPFLSLASAKIIIEGFKKIPFWVGTLFIISVFASSLWWGNFGLDWKEVTFIFRLSMIISVGLLGLSLLNFKNGLIIGRVVLIVILLFSFWLNIQTINKMGQIWPTLGDDTSVVPYRR